MAAAFAFAHANLVRELCMWPKAQFGPKHWIKHKVILLWPEEFARWALGVCHIHLRDWECREFMEKIQRRAANP